MKFGDIIENTWASESNPTKRGVFVRKFTRKGKVNNGKHVELTDMNGKFWDIQIGDHLSVIGSVIPLSKEQLYTSMKTFCNFTPRID